MGKRPRPESPGPRPGTPGPWPALVRAGLVCSTAGTILVFATGLADRYALAKFVTLAAGAALTWAGLTGKARREGLSLARTPLDLPMAALLLVAAAAAACSLDPLLSLFGHYRARFNNLLALLLYAALYQAVARSEDETGRERMLNACLAAGALAGLYAVMQWSGIQPISGVAEEGPEGRAYSTMGSPVYLGCVLLMLLPLSLRQALAGTGPGRFLAGAAGVCVAAGLAATLSRGAWLGALAGCGFYLAWRWRAVLERCGGKARLGLLAAAVLLAGGAVLGGNALRRHSTASDSSRWELWRCAARIGLRNPWLGTGPETFKLAFRQERTERYVTLTGATRMQAFAHNDLLETASTLGIFGMAAWLWLAWGTLTALRRRLAETRGADLGAALGGALLGFFLQIKLNPAPAAALALAAAFAGALAALPPAPPGSPRRGGTRWAAGMLALCGAILLTAGRMASADRNQKLGLRAAARGRAAEAAARFEDAIRLAPWEMHYRFGLVQSLHARARNSPGEARESLERAAGISAEAARLHPADFEAQQLHGVSLALQAMSGAAEKLPPARAALERARALDPLFLPLFEPRIAVARMGGDAGETAALEAEHSALKTRLGL